MNQGIYTKRHGIYQSPFKNKDIYERLSSESLTWDDFVNTPGLAQGVFLVAAGGGAGATVATEVMTDHPGIWQVDTGTTATGRTFIISGSANTCHVGVGGRTRVGTWLRTEPALSTALQRYTLRTGLFSITLPNVVVDGLGFEYDDSQNGGRWQAITHDGIETSTDTGIAVTASTWYKLEAEINDAGTSVDFFIDDVLVATNTTNIPSGTGFRLFYNTHIMKLLGTTSRYFAVDAYYLYQEVTR